MTVKTLYDIVRPICLRLNLFGYNFGNEKPAGWMRRGYKWTLKCLLMYAMWCMMMIECAWIKLYSESSLSVGVFYSILISGFCLQIFFVKEGEMEKMIKRMKQHPVGKRSQKNLNKQLIPFKIYSALVVIISLVAYLPAIVGLIYDFLIGKVSFTITVIGISYYACIFMVLQFPTLLSILPCIVACYCRAEMDETMEEMKRIKSPLRRAKAGAKLMEKYQQLYELASVTDVGLSTAIYFMKWMLFISFAAVVLSTTLMINDPIELNPNVMIWEYIGEYVSVLLANSLVAMYFPLFQYFYLAPSANQMFERMNRAIVDCGFMDAQQLSHDPIARPSLLKMRMEQIERMNHMATEDPPFTLFGDVLDNDNSFVN